MKNQEAITKLTNIMHDDHYAWSPSIQTAFGMAVDALRGADGDCISRQMLLEYIHGEPVGRLLCDKYNLDGLIEQFPSAQPESHKEKLKEIADALSEKFAYMNTCLNERDIILGYLGVKRPSKTHCNTDCTNTKCESHPLSSAQPEIIRCKDCNHHSGSYCHYKYSYGAYVRDDHYCGWAERREK